ncbi:hypothetical protein SDC9_103309 [bioreactor metagenome]|uniref:NAD-specific glutamate dehydrogenase n=1 Tax=bioreactor metagenome TaxID=1076179 RepID=A0A645B015_9ZZZZ
MEGIDKAGTEDIFANLRNLFVRSGIGDLRNLGSVGNFAAGQHVGRVVGAQDGEHAVLLNKLLHRVHGDLGLCFTVLGNKLNLDFFAVHIKAAIGSEFFGNQGDGIGHILAVQSLFTGDAGYHANLNYIGNDLFGGCRGFSGRLIGRGFVGRRLGAATYSHNSQGQHQGEGNELLHWG